MAPNLELEIERILAIVAKCPDALKERCFEILLTTYLESVKTPPSAPFVKSPPLVEESGGGDGNKRGIPDGLRSRFVAMAGRIGVTADQIASLFDFEVDPLNFHALSVPGPSKAIKMRNVAVLLAAKSYLITGNWTADWQEWRAVCVDQDCYDRANTAKNLTNAIFRTASATEGINLSSTGKVEAEKLIAQLAGKAD